MIFDLFNTPDDLGDTIHVKVTPKASSNRIKVEHQPDGTILYRVYVTVPPEDGKANEQVIKMLAKAIGVPKTSLSIVHGKTSREKTIKISK